MDEDREPAASAGAQGVEAHYRRMLERIAEVAPYFVFIYDYDLGRDVYINRSVPRALGYSAEEEAAMGAYPFYELCHPDDRPRALDRDERWRGLADGVASDVEFRLRHRNGEWRRFVSHNTPFRRDATGRVQQILGLSEDVTERRRSAELLRSSERLESLGMLAGGVAHDFSNLLTPILGNVELLLARLPTGSPLGDPARAIQSAAERATELVRQLLVYAGRGEIERRPVDLNGIVTTSVRLLETARPEPVATQLDLEPALPPVAGDASQLRQVVTNLVENAREATAGRRGAVRVATRRAVLDEGELARCVLREGVAPGPAVRLEVEDEGAGMDRDTVARLWEPFFTTKPRGRGLGFAAVLGILRQHRAALALESTPGVGTRIRIHLAPAGEVPAIR